MGTTEISVLRPDFKKRDGLVVVVAQHAKTKEVLMLAYANEEAWRQTLRTGIATYWSTSRNELWVKGATSNNPQRIVGISIDCDGDALIYHVMPEGYGLACHTDAYSCFFRNGLDPKMLLFDVPKPDAGFLETVSAEVKDDLVEVPF